ncbi:MAG TPA: cytochrome C oxidase subunit I, partial [Chitinophagaceae bacterium]|nr:cytochrome C oxidase subunit I [Chitinophagaceae bacterium]
MFAIPGNTISSTTTSHRVVLPFYHYASLAFLTATVVLVINTNDITKHYFHPYTLAVTHIMSLGWGTMIILGVAHQLVPVMIEGRLYSNKLAYASFILAALGIPLLVYGFYTFNMGLLTKCGGELIVAAIIAFLLNMAISMAKSKHENVHAFFVFTASLWLLATATVGLLLVYNFSHRFLPVDSTAYLSLHAHMGIVGWFLLLVIGVGSRLIPMFLISKYSNSRLLWWVYALINGGLLSFVFIFLYASIEWLFILPLLAVAASIV